MYSLMIIFALIFGPLLGQEAFVVGTTSAYAPYVSLDEKGDYVGFDIDIAKALCEKMNKKLILKDLGSMPSLLLALKKGKVDAVIWAVSITKERQKEMQMIHYQGEKVTSLPLLFWKQIPSQIASLEDMKNYPQAVITVEAGSFQESFLESVGNLQLKPADKVMDAILDIKYGKSLATMIDPALLPKYRQQFSELKILDIPLPEDAQSWGNGICIKDIGLALEVKKAIEALRQEGQISKLEDKWNLR